MSWSALVSVCESLLDFRNLPNIGNRGRAMPDTQSHQGQDSQHMGLESELPCLELFVL